MVESGHCFRHPGRAGVGICVECRRVICRECTTQFEGINRCSDCLGKKLAQLKSLPRRREWTFLNVLLAVASVGLLWGAVAGVAALWER